MIFFYLNVRGVRLGVTMLFSMAPLLRLHRRRDPRYSACTLAPPFVHAVREVPDLRCISMFVFLSPLIGSHVRDESELVLVFAAFHEQTVRLDRVAVGGVVERVFVFSKLPAKEQIAGLFLN